MPFPVRSVIAFAALLAAACVPAAGPLPSVEGRSVWRDPIARDHREGFPSESEYAPTQLAQAVLDDDVDRVRSLLDGGADPNARWTQRGDRFPLFEAIEASNYGRRL